LQCWYPRENVWGYRGEGVWCGGRGGRGKWEGDQWMRVRRRLKEDVERGVWNDFGADSDIGAD